MRVKNNKQTEDSWCGQIIEPQAEYDIQHTELSTWQSTDKVIQDITSLDLLIGDGTTYKQTSAEAVAYLLGAETGPNDPTGRPIVRTAATISGWRAEFHSFRVTTSTGVYSKDRAGNDTGLCTFKMYDAQGQETLTPAEAVRSTVLWEPNYDIEVVGAQAFQAITPTEELYLHVTLAPHIPKNLGGQVEFAIGGICLKDIGSGGVADFDGRASKYLPYDSVNHSSTWEFSITHPAGATHSITCIMEIFRP